MAGFCIAAQKVDVGPSDKDLAIAEKDRVAGQVYMDADEAKKEASDKKEKCKPGCDMMQNCKKNKTAPSEEEKEYRLMNPRKKSAAQEAVEGP